MLAAIPGRPAIRRTGGFVSEVVTPAQSRVLFTPAPPWADLPGVIPNDPSSADRAEGGRCFWLSDCQIRLADGEQVWLGRSVTEVTSPAGLQEAGALSLDFDPAFQTLSIHFVRIIRDGLVREVNAERGLELLRRERDLERAIFDGRLTAHLIIPDVRVGDVVDVCHSVAGQNPVLKDHFTGEWRFAWGCWVGETRVRLLSEADRDLRIQTWEAPPECVVRSLAGGEVERVWRAVATDAATGEALAPSWVRQVATVRVTDAVTWPEVAEAFRAFYEPQPLPEELEELARDIEAQNPEPADRVVAALRLVQSGLRYQSVTFGDGGFVPRELPAIWEGRTGDCKDSSRLLVTLLRRLGVDADAALVNAWRGRGLADEEPSLVAFDHCIVAATVGGRRYWLDPTNFPQGGRLDAIAQPRFGHALKLVEGAALEDMGEDDLADSLITIETYDLPSDPEGAGRLVVDTTHHGWRADAMRRRLAGGIAMVTREYVAFYERRFGKVSLLEPLEVTEDAAANTVRIVESYEVARIWNFDPKLGQVTFETSDDLFATFLPGLSPEEARRWPIDLGMPLRAETTIDIRSPVVTPPNEWDQGFSMDGLTASSRFLGVEPKVVRLVRRLVFHKPLVEGRKLRDYVAFREDAIRHAAVRIHHPVRGGRIVAGTEPAKGGPLGKVLWWVFAVFWILTVLGQATRLFSAPT
jgi:transglutaminase-like putative cysteine protease